MKIICLHVWSQRVKFDKVVRDTPHGSKSLRISREVCLKCGKSRDAIIPFDDNHLVFCHELPYIRWVDKVTGRIIYY